MVVQAFLAFAVLVYVDSGAPRPRLNFLRRRKGQVSSVPTRSDVTEEKDRVEKSGDVLRVVSLTKRFTSSNLLAVDDVTFGVAEGTNFALIGPNGAGKTTTLGCIRGVVSRSLCRPSVLTFRCGRLQVTFKLMATRCRTGGILHEAL